MCQWIVCRQGNSLRVLISGWHACQHVYCQPALGAAGRHGWLDPGLLSHGQTHPTAVIASTFPRHGPPHSISISPGDPFLLSNNRKNVKEHKP